MVAIEQLKELREKTGLSLNECRTALLEAGGDISRAQEILRARGNAFADKKQDRTLGAGTISAYVHATKQIGTIVELDSESDFVSKNEEFQKLAYDLAMHVSATNPESVEKLLTEPYVKDNAKTVQAFIEEYVQKFGEKIKIARFSRFMVLR